MVKERGGFVVGLVGPRFKSQCRQKFTYQKKQKKKKMKAKMRINLFITSHL